MQKASAMWILKTRELHRIPQSVMDMMIGDIQSLFQTSLFGISQRVKMTLSEAGIDDSISKSILSNFKEGQPFCNVFSGLQSHHHQLIYLKRNCDLVVSYCYDYMYANYYDLSPGPQQGAC